MPSDIVLAIHPCTSGFGFAAFEAPLALVSWGRRSGRNNADLLTKIEKLVDLLQVRTIILEEFETGHSRRHVRMQRLYRSIAALASMRGMHVRVLSRSAIRSCFAATNAQTRYEVAQAVALNLEELRPDLPPPRKAWQPEDHRMALFAAAALGIAHYAHPEPEDERKAA